MEPTLVFLPGNSHEQRSLARCSPSGGRTVGNDFVTKQQQQRCLIDVYWIRGCKNAKWSEVKWKVAQLCLTLCEPFIDLSQNTGVDSLFLRQGIFPTQGSNPGLLHCRQILYQLSHKGKPNDNQQMACVANSLNESHGYNTEGRSRKWTNASVHMWSSKPDNWTVLFKDTYLGGKIIRR